MSTVESALGLGSLVTVCGLILVGLKVGTEATRRWERHARVTAGLVLLVVAWFTVADVL